MEIIVARHAGFCFGVERAIDIAKHTAEEYTNVVTYGPIIHNPQVVEDLERDGITSVKGLDNVDSSMSVVIRSHGIEREEADALKKKAGTVIDASCPFVQKAQKSAEKLSKESEYIIILGEADHPEVKGIVSYITGGYKVIEKAEEIDNLPFRESYGFLAQTTQNSKVFEEAVKRLGSKCNKLNVSKTICSATEHRQEAAVEVASKVEVMIVVGGKNSANTTRLYHLCKEICPKTYHIETPEELDAGMFHNVLRVGITAGASTPVGMISKVREYILEVTK